MSLWVGGPCLQCGEQMPKNMLRCRNCGASLADEIQPVGVSNPASPPSKATEPRSVKPPAESRSAVPSTFPAGPQILPVASTMSAGAVSAGATSVSSACVFWGVALLLLAPLAVSGPIAGAPAALSIGWPRIHSGDEPHHLVLVNSVVADGDLDVANNYDRVHHGGRDAGEKFVGWALDHHVDWYWHHRRFHWWQVFETDYHVWHTDASGQRVPTLRAQTAVPPPGEHEYSRHPAGLALVLAPVLFPFRGTAAVEPLALVCSALCTVAGMLFFRLMIGGYSTDRGHVALATAAVFLGTPVWAYGRTLFPESFLMCCAVGAYALALREWAFLRAGVLLALGLLIKPVFVLVALPLFIDRVLAKDRGSVVRLGGPILLAVCVLATINHRQHGLWFTPSLAWEPGIFLSGLMGLLFSVRHGLLPFAPVVLPALLAWPAFLRDHQREGLLLLAGVLLYTGLFAFGADWGGGACYGPRLIVPVIPLLCVPLATLPTLPIWQNFRVRWALLAVVALSVGLNATGAFACEHGWEKHPFEVLRQLI